MSELDILTSFLGWCTIINIGLLIFSFIFTTVFGNFTANFHGKLTGIDPKDLPIIYFSYLGIYKVAIIVFNLVPYLALKLMA